MNHADFEAIGRTLAQRYRLESVLGQGGMGCVYAAKDLRLERSVAIKVIRPEYHAESGMLERFAREAKILAQLDTHPHILTIYDLDYDSAGRPFIVTERLTGRSLKALLKDIPRPSRSWVLEVGLQITLALLDIHARGITHRDIKPGNVFIVETTVIPLLAKVIDFGLAQTPKHVMLAGSKESGSGTLQYLPPEVLDGQEWTPASDIYSLGITLYELSTGQSPYPSAPGSAAEMLAAHRSKTPLAFPTDRGVFPEKYQALVMSMLSKNPTQRPNTETCLRGLRSADTELNKK